MYTYTKKILYSDVDATRYMALSSLMDMMQDCINLHSQSVGRGISYMLAQKRTWFAISWNIELRRIPEMFETLTAATWPYEFSASIGYRNVVVTDEAGEVVICADSMWTLMDMDSGRPIRIADADIEGYELEPRYPMEQRGRKIKLPKDFCTLDTVRVPKAFIDYNGHMSNAKYLQLANEYIDDPSRVRRIRVEYKSQTMCGEALRVECADGNGLCRNLQAPGEICRQTESEDQRTVIRILGADGGDIKAVLEYE